MQTLLQWTVTSARSASCGFNESTCLLRVTHWEFRNGHIDNRPRKRTRTTPVEKDAVDLWWDAMQSDAMIGNAVPVLRYASSDGPTELPPPTTITDPPRRAGVRPRKKRKRGPGPDAEKTLLYHMNNNIRTFRRIQNAYAKLAVLKETLAADDAQQGGSNQLTFIPPPVLNDVEDTVDDRPWRPTGSGLDLGEANSNDCLRWASSKILQHVGFQGKYLNATMPPHSSPALRDIQSGT